MGSKQMAGYSALHNPLARADEIGKSSIRGGPSIDL
jgi:hypothetical protein